MGARRRSRVVRLRSASFPAACRKPERRLSRCLRPYGTAACSSPLGRPSPSSIPASASTVSSMTMPTWYQAPLYLHFIRLAQARRVGKTQTKRLNCPTLADTEHLLAFTAGILVTLVVEEVVSEAHKAKRRASWPWCWLAASPWLHSCPCACVERDRPAIDVKRRPVGRSASIPLRRDAGTAQARWLGHAHFH